MTAEIKFEESSLHFDAGALVELLHSPLGGVAKRMLRAAIAGETAAKQRAPVDTGRLRSSIRNVVQEEGGEVVGYIGSDVHYAIYVEMGTGHMTARPFLRPALDVALEVFK